MSAVSSQHDGLTYAQRAALACTAGDQDRAALELHPQRFEASDRRPRLESVEQMLPLIAYASAQDGRVRGRAEASAMFDILQGHVLEDVQQAFRTHARRSRFPVTTADIVEIIEEGL